MAIQITIERSNKWVRARRLVTGTNVPDRITLEVEPSDLSTEARAALLAWGDGEYRVFTGGFTFNSSFELSHYSTWGRDYPQVDAESPTAAHVDAAILAANERIATKRAEWQTELERRRAEAEVEQQAKAAKEAALSSARELLAGEIAILERHTTNALERLVILSDFLCKVPLDALRGTLRKLAHDGQQSTIDALQEKVEDAATRYVFTRDEEDDE